MLLILRPIQAYYPRDEMIDVHITAWYRDRREWDIDNISKPILDILQASVESVIDGTPEWHSMPIIEDDKQVRELTLTKMPYDPDKPDGEFWIDIKPS